MTYEPFPAIIFLHIPVSDLYMDVCPLAVMYKKIKGHAYMEFDLHICLYSLQVFTMLKTYLSSGHIHSTSKPCVLCISFTCEALTFPEDVVPHSGHVGKDFATQVIFAACQLTVKQHIPFNSALKME